MLVFLAHSLLVLRSVERARGRGSIQTVPGQRGDLPARGVTPPLRCYAFVRRAFRIPWHKDEPLTFIPRPSDDELFALAQLAVERLVDRARTRSRPNQGDGD